MKAGGTAQPGARVAKTLRTAETAGKTRRRGITGLTKTPQRSVQLGLNCYSTAARRRETASRQPDGRHVSMRERAERSA
jgi:hypothetical protein